MKERSTKAQLELPKIERKHRHHHVWQEYLRAWAPQGKIYCRMGDRIFPAGTNAVAVEGDFYAFEKLTSTDVAFIEKLVIEPANQYAQRTHRNFLRLLSSLDYFEGLSEEIDALVATNRANAIEDHHAGIEGLFLPLLNRLREGDTSFLANDADYVNFLHYLSTQHMRTKGTKTVSLEGIRRVTGHDLSRAWDVIALMFAVNIGGSLYVERTRRKLVVIDNATGIELIAGDQPTINRHAVPGTPPETLSIYYPISPSKALFLTEVDEGPPELTADLVIALNKEIAAASHAQIFAATSAALEPYQVGPASPDGARP